jgi:hypothetical protein
VSIYRRKKLIKTIKVTDDDNPVLDIKVQDGYLYYTTGGMQVERLNIKEI